MIPDYNRAKWIIENLCVGTLGKWSGKPVQLLPWQDDILKAICAVDSEGERVFNDCWIEVPRKAGKTAFCSYLAICGMLMEDNPEVLVAAATKDQAHILYKYTTDAIRLSPKLSALLEPYRSEIRIKNGLGHMLTVPSDGGAVHGKNPSLIICDELHAWSPTKAEALYEALDTSRGARNTLMIVITTAGSAFSYAHSLHRRAKKILNGDIYDDSYHVVIHAAEETDNPADPETWYKANPSLGVTIPESWYAKQYERAKNDAGRLASFKKLQLNQWEGSSSPWIEIQHWRKWTREPEGWETWNCMLGIDLSSVNDWEAYVCLFYRGEEIYVKPFFQIPVESWQHRSEHYTPDVAQWIDQGHINVISGMVHTDEHRLRMINSILSKYDVQHICFDPYNAHKVAKELNSVHGEEFCIAIRQGVLFINEPMKELYRRGMLGQVNHDGNPVAEAHISACNLFQDKNGNYFYDKSKATDKIDFVAGLITGMAGVLHYEDESFYENNDIVFG